MDKKQARMIVESLPSLYPMMRDVEEEAIWALLATDINVGTKIRREPLELVRAIDGLAEWQKHVQTDSNINRDITIAIEALKAQLGTRAVRGYTIDADALMERVAEEYGERARDRLYQIIRYMPPAQPEPCEDAVSRKAAIAQMQGLTKWNGIIADSCVDFDDVISVLENKENLPPVTPKQRTGKWVMNDHIGTFKIFTCSECGWNSEAPFNFCHNCGSYNGGKDEV